MMAEPPLDLAEWDPFADDAAVLAGIAAEVAEWHSEIGRWLLSAPISRNLS